MNTESNESTAEEATQSASGRPAAKFSGTGGINVAVWKHKNESGYDNYSVRIERSYKDKNGDYQSTEYLRDSDLLRTQKLLEQADNWIEQDKGRLIGQSAAQSR